MNTAAEPIFKYEPLQVQSMQKIPGQRFIPMQIGISTDNNKIFGSFLDKDVFAVHWYHESISENKAGRTYQTEGTTPIFTVEYPILSYTDAYTDKRKLLLCNLADD